MVAAVVRAGSLTGEEKEWSGFEPSDWAEETDGLPKRQRRNECIHTTSTLT